VTPAQTIRNKDWLPSIYPYTHICWCGQSWQVTESKKEQHETEFLQHRAEHKKQIRKEK